MVIDILPVGPIQANCYILSDLETKEALVIDPGDEEERIASVIDKKNLSVKYIFLTHGHFDHCFGIDALQSIVGGKIGLHKEDLSLYKTGGGASGFGFPAKNFPAPDFFLEEGKEFSFGKHNFTVLHTPGHTPGHLCFYFSKEDVLFTGDLLFASGIGRTDLPGGSTDTLFRSLREKILILPENTKVYPGHGPATSIQKEKTGNPWLRF